MCKALGLQSSGVSRDSGMYGLLRCRNYMFQSFRVLRFEGVELRVWGLGVSPGGCRGPSFRRSVRLSGALI